mmetsp:Transcript_18756/g.13586  ORF Transcript_18756/g.13586 Transcript_18756/m.13586 type:complete len:97 (-) Transcript_18756:111-401(-)
MFKQLDKNGDGMLSKQEILEGYEEVFGISIDEDEVDKIFSDIDLDKNGTIDYTEFIMSTLNENLYLSKEMLERAFAMFDKDKNGTISRDEIKEVLD